MEASEVTEETPTLQEPRPSAGERTFDLFPLRVG